MHDDLRGQTTALLNWLCDAALPFWARTAIDAEGGWYEYLTPEGTPEADVIRRMRVQARQIYVYALAEKMGWYPGKSIVKNTYDFMCKFGLSPDSRPGFIHLIGPDYSIENDRRDFYDHAFYLLGCGWAYHAAGENAPYLTGLETADFVDSALKSPEGGWTEGRPEQLPRRQNPHMHFLEASMAWHDITGDPRWMENASEIYALFKAHFFDGEHHIIREFFEDDWSRFGGGLGDSVEPGHAAEWIWLLWLFQQRSGIDTSAYAQKLYEKLLMATDGFQNDEEEPDGTPRRRTKRLWVQTELIKAHLAQTERGVAGAADAAARTMAAFYTTYLRADGTWMDQIDEQGRPAAKTIPTSSFYHIICMIYEAGRVSGVCAP